MYFQRKVQKTRNLNETKNSNQFQTIAEWSEMKESSETERFMLTIYTFLENNEIEQSNLLDIHYESIFSLTKRNKSLLDVKIENCFYYKKNKYIVSTYKKLNKVLELFFSEKNEREFLKQRIVLTVDIFKKNEVINFFY